MEGDTPALNGTEAEGQHGHTAGGVPMGVVLIEKRAAVRPVEGDVKRIEVNTHPERLGDQRDSSVNLFQHDIHWLIDRQRITRQCDPLPVGILSF